MKSPSSDSGSPARTAEKSDVEALFDDASDLTDLSDEERKDDAVEDDTSESDLTDIEEDEEQEEETKQKSDSDVSMASGSKEEAEFVELETVRSRFCLSLVLTLHHAFRSVSLSMNGKTSQNSSRAFAAITSAGSIDILTK